jgi:hypothetical protein
VHFISGLMAYKTPFLAADLGPDVEPFLLHLYAALAEKRRAVIAQRAKAALAGSQGSRPAAASPNRQPGTKIGQKAFASAPSNPIAPAFNQTAS